MNQYVEFISEAGASLAATNVFSGAGQVKWMVREQSQHGADNGWRIVSHIDTDEYLADSKNLEIVNFNELCGIEPVLIGIWDLPVGSDLQIVNDDAGKRVVETASGRVIPLNEQYIPPQFREPAPAFDASADNLAPALPADHVGQLAAEDSTLEAQETMRRPTRPHPSTRATARWPGRWASSPTSRSRSSTR